MSGIIGGAGSKSGVIGETEIYYEEGGWIPVVADASSGGNVATPDTGLAVGKYTKIGNMVNVNALYQMSSESLTDGNALYIRGFPFTSSSTANCNYQGIAYFHRIDTLENVTLVMGPSATSAACEQKSSIWDTSNITGASIRYASTSYIRINLTYQTD
jgi:hypothetical protein